MGRKTSPPEWTQPSSLSSRDIVHHTGASILPTVLEPEADPALNRLHINRLSARVDALTSRITESPEKADKDAVWALQQRAGQLERRLRILEWGSLLFVGALVGWTAVLTAIMVAVFLT